MKIKKTELRKMREKNAKWILHLKENEATTKKYIYKYIERYVRK